MGGSGSESVGYYESKAECASVFLSLVELA